METSDKIKEILKTMATFNVEEDLFDDEARQELINYFSEIVNTEDDIGKAFLGEVIKRMNDILVDMSIVEAEPTGDDELPAVEEPVDDTNEGYLFKLDVAERANDFLM